MVDITRERAQEIISEIYHQSGGFLADNEREGALASVLGSPVLEAAARAWTSDTRFIYELIQNAEDASYDCALSQKERPDLKFYIYPDRVVVESNADAFDERDVRAICSAGRGTKTGQIGEKGIGFKSVFKVASKVIIQSGPFCFSFQHRAGENGLGMIAPVNEAHEDLPEGGPRAFTVRTRMTLLSLQPELYSSIYSMVEKLPYSTTAFLSKIEFVRFNFSDPKLPMESAIFTRILAQTKLSCDKYENDKIKSHKFFYFNRKVPGLPGRESRPPPQEADIILAFPLDKQLELNTQPFAHAYLPLRGHGVNFLIQSDFVTRDNREELADCPWNDHLMSHLPSVFGAALEVVCRKPDLETSWPRFLPLKELQEPYWSQFRDTVLKDFKHLRLFKTRRGTLKSLDEVRYLLPEHCDKNGDPLFGDSDEDIYLSSQYAESYDLLKPFGLQPVSSRQLLDRFCFYLEGPQPRFLHDKKVCNSHWHAQVALLLSSWMDSPLDSIANELKYLPLVPIQNVTQPSPSSSQVLKSPRLADIYFPLDSGGNEIPDSLIDLIPLSYKMDEPRKQLFSRLGVKCADPSFVLEKICELNESKLRTPSLPQSISNLRYVFAVKPDWESVDPRCVLLYDRDGTVSVKTSDICFSNAMLQEAVKRVAGSGFATTQIRFLHLDYTPPFRADTDWIKWLQKVGPIRRAPRLETQGSPAQPSDILRNVINYAPSFLIKILQKYWDIYEEELTNASPGTVSAIKRAIVPVESGMAALEKSFLGTSGQRAIWSSPELKGKFPFLYVGTGWQSEDRTEWRFLSRFGVTTTITTDFLVASATELSRVFPRRHAKDAFFGLYGLLTADSFNEFCAQMSDTDLFIYIPQSGTDDRLVRPSDCVWHGDVSGTKHVLASHDAYTQNLKVKSLFQAVLGSQGGEWVTKLSILKTTTDVALDSLYEVYSGITGGLEPGHTKAIHDGFENGQYIYIPHENIWRPPSCCVWSTRPRLDGRYGIRHHYPNLGHFFVQTLGVTEPDIPGYIEEILSLTQEEKVNTSELLLIMQKLNNLHPTADELSLLKFARFIPLKCKATGVTYVTPNSQFLIIDDTRLQLDPEVPILDITPEDACRLRHLFAALDLETRYVSGQIKETTCDDALEDVEKSVELTQDFRQRAEALCRCTIYYGGMLPNDKMQRLFSEATVSTAKGFRRHFHVGYGLVTKESHEGRLHCREVDNSLQLYVPQDKKERAICYATELPQALVQYMEIDHQAACGTFATILRESPDILDGILSGKGIIHSAMGLSDELPIRTKSHLASQDTGINHSSSLALTQALDRMVSIELEADQLYIDEQNQVGSCGILLDKYSLTGVYFNENDPSAIVSKYLKVKPEDGELTLTETALKAAAESVEFEQMDLLLSDLATQGQVPIISQPVLEAAARNDMSGHKIMCLLRDISKSHGHNLDITDSILEAAAENEVFGPEITAILLQCLQDQGEEIMIADSVLEAAAGNTESGEAVVALLLEYRDQSGWITEDIVLAAVRNEDLGSEIIRQLLEGPGNIRVSHLILQAAAENHHQGDEIIDLLLSKDPGDIQVTEEVIISAVHNDESGMKILERLVTHNHGYLEITERIMLAAAESEHCMEVTNLFLNLPKGNLPITNGVFKTVARNGTGNELTRLLELSHSDMEVTEEFFDTDVDVDEKLTTLLHHGGRITERVMLAAAARKAPESVILLKSILAKPHDPVTDAVLEAAIENPRYGPELIELILADAANDLHVSETSLQAAARNPISGPEILPLLLKNWPDIRISDDVILAAAETDTNAVERLIHHINTLPAEPIQMTEELLEAIAGNGTCGATVLRLLLDTRVKETSPIPITQAALVNAAGNIQCGYGAMSLLLDHGGEVLGSLITEDVTIAAAGNPSWGLEIVALLHDREYLGSVSMHVFAAAKENIWCGEDIIAFLLRHQVTETESGGLLSHDEDQVSTEDEDTSEDTSTSEDGDWSDGNTEVPGSEGSDSSGDAYETADDG